MAKSTKQPIELEHIPSIFQKVATIIEREIDMLGDKDTLSDTDTKNLISYTQVLSALYKDYRAEMLEVKKELKSMSKEEISAMIRSEVK